MNTTTTHCRIPTRRLARVVDAGRIITAGGIASGMELGFHQLRRAGNNESFISEVGRGMECHRASELYCNDLDLDAAQVGARSR